MINEAQRQGIETPADQKVPVSVRDWNAVKLAMWRNKVGWQIAARAAFEILARCRHADGCPGVSNETEQCVADLYEKPDPEAAAVLVTRGCPDREQRMSALVMLNAARQFAPLAARQPAQEPYFAPSREYFSEVLSSFLAVEAELDATKAELARFQSMKVEPPSNADVALEALAPPPPPRALREFYDQLEPGKEEEEQT